MDLFLISNSTNHGQTYFSHVMSSLDDFLGERRRIAFVPYALADHERYTATVTAGLAPLGAQIESVHRQQDITSLLDDSDAVLIGGGNTFRLLRDLRRFGLLEPIAARVRAGDLAYIGSSAGTNVATPTIRTTNDMPIVECGDLSSLGLVPFQINPHYLDADPGSVHMGETRAQRISQFLEENDSAVLGLREGCWLVAGDRLRLEGPRPAVLFERGSDPREVDGDLSELLTHTPRFDVGSS